MFSALWTATRSSCLNLQTGAVIVKDKRIIASGYNGAPPGIKSSLELNSCRKEEHGINFEDKGKSVCRGLHAEMNAIDQIARENLNGTSIYSLYYPCSSCAKEIVGNGIIEVVYSKIYAGPDSLTKELFKEGKIQLKKLELDTKKYFDMIKDILEEK